MDLTEFASAVGDSGPVSVHGLGSRRVRRDPSIDSGRFVIAPSGVSEYQPDEMTIACGAGTTLAELRAVTATSRQFVALPGDGTVGGALAIGRSGIDRLGVGPVRDALLQVTFVDHRGRLVAAGGPTVKNVSGFDLARLLVGSFGRLGFIAHVILRTRPLPANSRWFVTEADAPRVSDLQSRLYRPAALLWDGRQLHVRLDGHADDITAAARVHGLSEVAGPPVIDQPYRWSVAPSRVGAVVEAANGRACGEVGVGIVHHVEPQPGRRETLDPIEARLFDEFDPHRRLNPDVLFPQ